MKNARRVQRAGALTQSFRRMAETVHLRPKDGPSRLERAPSRRSKLLSRFFDQQGDEKERRKSRQELERRGILRREEVFGNHLSAVAMDPDTGVPFFLVRCVRRLDQLVDTVGIYRVNGDAAAVQKVRWGEKAVIVHAWFSLACISSKSLSESYLVALRYPSPLLSTSKKKYPSNNWFFLLPTVYGGRMAVTRSSSPRLL